MHSSSISDLPAEIRVKIFSYLPQTEIVHHIRCVCKTWRDDVDNLCDFAVELDDRKHGWERLLELRVRQCRIVHFLSPPPSGPGTTVLKHTNVIKSLKISDKITPSNLYYLLGDCSSCLVSLKLCIGSHLLGYVFPTKLSRFNFQRLQYLEVQISTLPNPDSMQDSSFGPPFLTSSDTKYVEDLFHDLLSLRLRYLQSLKVQIRCWGFSQVSKFMASSLSCIANHCNTMRVFDVDLMIGHGLPTTEVRPIADSDIGRINGANLKSVTKLESLRLVSSSPIGVNLWIDLVEQQKQLKTLEVDIFPAPSSVFTDTISANLETLVFVEITDLMVWDEEGFCSPFDMATFGPCFSLKKLIIDRNVTRRRVFDAAELINLYSLPSNLDELALNYFNILSDELLLYCSSEGGETLKTLYLTQCGNSGNFGVDGTVLEKIIDMPSISFIEISTLNFSDPEEREKLNMILETFGYNENHSYFQLTKKTQSIPIKFRAYFLDSEDSEDFLEFVE